MTRAVASGAPWPGAVAVSGGGDSVALMLLLEKWAKARGKPAPVVLTVDHGLRKGSASDARKVVEHARVAGLEGHVLIWRGVKPSADIEAAGRNARYHLMGSWCRRHGIKGLYVAHTLEDQAETLLLRLARGSGIDGLSAMAPVARFPSPDCDDLVVVRPLLGTPRGCLRRYLEERGETWIEDGMNADTRFARVRLRAAWPALEAVGLTPARVALAAQHLGRAREALEQQTSQLLAQGCRFDDGRAVLDGVRLAAAPSEIGLRAFAAVLMRMGGQTYRPRFNRLEQLFGLIRSGKLETARTLHGCRVGPAPKREAIFGSGTLIVQCEPQRNRRAQRNVD